MTVDYSNKREATKHLLERGSVFVYLDPRVENVQCPPWLKEQTVLVLQYGLNLRIPIPDLRVDDHGIFGTLSFKGRPFVCFCPWHSIFAILDDKKQAKVWSRSMPAELRRSRTALPAGWRIINGGKAPRP